MAKFMNLIFRIDGEITQVNVNFKPLDGLTAFLNDKIEDLFDAYLSGRSLSLIIDKLHTIGQVQTSDVKPNLSAGTIALDSDYYVRFVNSVFDLMDTVCADYMQFKTMKQSFCDDRKLYANMFFLKTHVGSDVAMNRDLAIGFNEYEQDVCMARSSVNDFVENFHQTYSKIIPLWSEFVKEFFIDECYPLFSTSVRYTVKEGKLVIYRIDYISPFLRNNVLFQKTNSGPDDKYVKVKDLDVSLLGSTSSFRDPLPVQSYERTIDANRNDDSLDIDYVTLLRKFSRIHEIKQIDESKQLYRVMYYDKARVVRPPENSIHEVSIDGFTNYVPGNDYTTELVDVLTCPLLDLLFLVREQDVNSLEQIYKKRLALLGSNYSLGKANFYQTFDSNIVTSVASMALFITTLSRLAAEMYVNSYKFSLKIKDRVEINRIVTLKRTQIVDFPIAGDNIKQFWFTKATASSDYEGFYGIEGQNFWISKEPMDNVFSGFHTGKVLVDLTRDFEYSDMRLIHEDINEGTISFIYDPDLAPSEKRSSFVTIGTENLADYQETNVPSANPLDLIMRILFTDYLDCMYKTIPGATLQSHCSGVHRFIGEKIARNGVVSDSQTYISQVTWQQVMDFLLKVKQFRLGDKGQDDKGKDLEAKVRDLYIKGFQELFSKDAAVISKRGFPMDAPLFCDVYQLLIDRFNNIARQIGGDRITPVVRITSPLVGLLDISIAKQMIAATVVRKIESAVKHQVFFDSGVVSKEED